MQVQIYYNKNYIPFNLYINSIYNIFKTNSYFTQNNYEVSIINHISHINRYWDGGRDGTGYKSFAEKLQCINYKKIKSVYIIYIF
jgi:hypothetical protein